MLIRPQKYAQNQIHQTKPRNNRVQPQKSGEKAKKQQERAKNRSETNKNANSERKNADSETRVDSEPGANSYPRAKKRGVFKPLKKYTRRFVK